MQYLIPLTFETSWPRENYRTVAISSTLFLGRRRISSVVDEVRHRALHALWKNFLDLLGHN
jgi:hypothetical protein